MDEKSSPDSFISKRKYLNGMLVSENFDSFDVEYEVRFCSGMSSRVSFSCFSREESV